jgi:hypothetical protein
MTSKSKSTTGVNSLEMKNIKENLPKYCAICSVELDSITDEYECLGCEKSFCKEDWEKNLRHKSPMSVSGSLNCRDIQRKRYGEYRQQLFEEGTARFGPPSEPDFSWLSEHEKTKQGNYVIFHFYTPDGVKYTLLGKRSILDKPFKSYRWSLQSEPPFTEKQIRSMTDLITKKWVSHDKWRHWSEMKRLKITNSPYPK